MFRNLVSGSPEGAVVHLSGGNEAASRISKRLIKRRVEIWQTRAFVFACMEDLGAANAYQLERTLTEAEGDTFDYLRRPHVVDRMTNLGEPAVNRRERKVDSVAARWTRLMFKLSPAARQTLKDPFWRLLQPEPLSLIELKKIEGSVTARGAPRRKAGRVGTKKRFGELVDWVLGADRDRDLGLTALLLELRRAEVHLEFETYYLALLAICDVSHVRSEPLVRAVASEICNYVKAVFGTVCFPLVTTPAKTKALKERLLRSGITLLSDGKPAGYANEHFGLMLFFD